MQSPHIELISLPAAIESGCPTTLDVVVKIVPPELDATYQRPSLNLGLVIDRSSSMSLNQRIEYAKAAARQLLEELSPGDRMSITTFDYSTKNVLPSTFARNKASIIRAIQNIQLGKWTNLYAGWVEGGNEVSKQTGPGMANRVILLSDGWTNVGITDPKTIVSHVQQLAQVGISTTTVGFGNDYHEDLLEQMANGGDGNYYYVNSPYYLPEIFQKEVKSLVATLGQHVTLGIEPQGDVEVLDVLNDLETNSQGRFKLPNLVAGYPFNIVVRLRIPALTQDTNLCHFRLSWSSYQQSTPQSLRVTLSLPIVHQSMLDEFPDSLEVKQQVALMQVARSKRKAIALVDQKNYAAAQLQLNTAKKVILALPASPFMKKELTALELLENDLRTRQVKQFRKRSHHQAHITMNAYDQTMGPWLED